MGFAGALPVLRAAGRSQLSLALVWSWWNISWLVGHKACDVWAAAGRDRYVVEIGSSLPRISCDFLGPGHSGVHVSGIQPWGRFLQQLQIWGNADRWSGSSLRAPLSAQRSLPRDHYRQSRGPKSKARRRWRERERIRLPTVKGLRGIGRFHCGSEL